MAVLSCGVQYNGCFIMWYTVMAVISCGIRYNGCFIMWCTVSWLFYHVVCSIMAVYHVV